MTEIRPGVKQVADQQRRCFCQCGTPIPNYPKSCFVPGHDSKLKSRMISELAAGRTRIEMFGVDCDILEAASWRGWQSYVHDTAEKRKRKAATTKPRRLKTSTKASRRTGRMEGLNALEQLAVLKQAATVLKAKGLYRKVSVSYDNVDIILDLADRAPEAFLESFNEWEAARI